jgi:hypothetical protein
MHERLSVCTLAVLSLIVLGPTSLAYSQEAPRAAPTELVFSAILGTKGIVYKVDNEAVSDPLRGLGKEIEKYGEDLPVICLIDSRLPIRLTGEAPALAGKAGFKNVRTFALDHVSGKISEIKLGPWVPAPK